MNTLQFPEIAKAVGGQRGGKYLKRIPKPGGGYRYVYKETEGKGSETRKRVAADAVNKLRKERWSPEGAAGAVLKVMKERPELENAKEIVGAARKELKTEQMIVGFKERAKQK